MPCFNMRNIDSKELKLKFVEALSELDSFTYEVGNPFLIQLGLKEYFIFLKNISSASFPKYPDVTRAQLPFSDRFAKIAAANIPFVILGYDIDNDVIVSWNPNKVKERLNSKSNVSLYSRETLQSDVLQNEFKEGFLSTGEKILLFKRKNIAEYFNNFKQFSWENKTSDKGNIVEEPFIPTISSKLLEITDANLLTEILPLIKQNKVLQVAKILAEFYGDDYKNMTLKDWFDLVKKTGRKI